MEIPVLFLKKGHERRLRAGHLWIYSNEVDNQRSPLRQFAPGEQVAIMSHDGKWRAWAYVNPHSLICARVVSRWREHPLSVSLLVHRLNVALGLRERLYALPYYRLLFAESDGLPGLVVDRYGDYLVAQLSTAGMEAVREAIVEALVKVLHPKGILWRNDVPARLQEGLSTYVEVAWGDVPEVLDLTEGETRFRARPFDGQKTGWFYDQAANRRRVLSWVNGKRVLDVFSYAGAWGVRALQAGASEAWCVDASARALEEAQANARLNRTQERLQTLRKDAFEALHELKSEGERFDVVIVDPPAFIKKKKDQPVGLHAYRRINELALGLLNKDGLLISASCSYHLEEAALLKLIQQGARRRERYVQLIERGQQAPDHPVHPAIPETAYLKAFFMRVLPAF